MNTSNVYDRATDEYQYESVSKPSAGIQATRITPPKAWYEAMHAAMTPKVEPARPWWKWWAK